MYKKNYAIVLKDARGNITSMPLNIYNKKSTRIKNTPMSNGKTHRGFTSVSYTHLTLPTICSV